MAPGRRRGAGPSSGPGSYLRSLPKEEAPQAAARKGGSWKAVLVVASVVLIASLAVLCAIVFSYLMGQQKYNSLTSHFDNYSDEALDDPLYAQVDWDGLLETNPDTVAWLYIPNTDINYPVVRGTDNEYYLSHDFEGDEGWLAVFGAIFMDYRDNPDWGDQAYFFYGHHMNDGSMFADIAAMAEQGFFDEARNVYLYSPSGNFELRSYSLIHCSADDPLVQVSFESAKDMAAYVQDKMDRSIVEVDDEPKASEVRKSFAFSTCDNYSMGRYVLFCDIERTTVRDLVYERTKVPSPGDAQSGVRDV